MPSATVTAQSGAELSCPVEREIKRIVIGIRANRRLAQHLEHEQPYLFTFLNCPGLDATNHEAERAVRWMVIASKVWGGNRTWEGAQTQPILVSILRTCWQQDKDPFSRIVL